MKVTMRRWLLRALAVSACVIALQSCKTNEKNMSDAYNLAVADRDADDLGIDSTIYTDMRRRIDRGTMTVGGDSVEVASVWVKVTEDGGGVRENLKRYNVVVGQFKQLFNAKSMRERLVDNGYPGAFVVNTSEPYYFVVAASYAEAPQAVEMLKHTLDDPSLKMKKPLPFILEPAQHRR